MKKLDFMFRIFIVLLFTLILFSCEKNVTRPTDPAVVPAGMVFVPGGNFLMGSAEGTQMSVILSPFYMAKYQVTQAEYEEMVGSLPHYLYGLGDDYPIHSINWFNAIKYCNLRSAHENLTPVYSIDGVTDFDKWAHGGMEGEIVCDWDANGYRLPTEAEWEYAARGAANNPDYLYSGSNDLDEVGWFDGNNTTDGVKPVGQKLPNGLGIYDMSGNVWEWCWDYPGGYEDAPQVNPSGGEGSGYRILRGGHWGNFDTNCTVFFRHDYYDFTECYSFGMRVCRSIR